MHGGEGTYEGHIYENHINSQSIFAIMMGTKMVPCTAQQYIEKNALFSAMVHTKLVR